MMCEGIVGTMVPGGNQIGFDPPLDWIDSSCITHPVGEMPTDDVMCRPPLEASDMQDCDVDLGSQIRPWWGDCMNDPDHPSRRKPRPRSADELSCGPLGGCMGLDWYWIGCPSPYSKRPKTPAFYH